MDALTTIMTLKALDGLSVRATVTAQNIANAGTPNYRPLRVTFERALADASAVGGSAVEAVKPKVECDDGALAGSGLRLDLEMATATMTAGRYAALIEILNRRMQIDHLAITGSN